MPRSDDGMKNGGQSADLSPAKLALNELRRLRAELDRCRRGEREPVAILGMAVRLPGGVTTTERFWSALAAGEDLVGTVPAERWDAQTCVMCDAHGGFLSNVDAFDAEFFGINAREAASMDPQHRILLELTWEALERSAIDPLSLMNSRTGIWLGLSNSDYGRMLIEDPRKIDGYTGVGAATSIAAGRIAYFLGTNGPAQVIDTACSSSLVAVHQAVESLRRGESSLAIVGGANLILSPEMNLSFSRTGMLSRRGRCHTFDAAADGYVRAEGCCVIVLKRLADAERAGDRALATIRGSAINQDGRSAGITSPNGPAQEAVMRSALKDAGLGAETVSYIEAHGTGTPLGDPMEFRAVGAVYGAGRSADAPLRIGSVKTNLGHTEAAAGLAGLIKVVLMMQPGNGIVPHLHFTAPSAQIDWDRWPIEIPVSLTPWNDLVHTRYAGISSFGFSGTNAHVIVGSHAAWSSDVGQDCVPTEREELLCISAAREGALRELAARYVSFLRESRLSFDHICSSAATTRAKLQCRLAVRAATADDAADLLERWLAGAPVPGLLTTETTAIEEGVDQDALARIAREFVLGGGLQYGHRSRGEAVVELPVYPFQRKRFWFNEPPELRARNERDQIWQEVRGEAERQGLQGPLGWAPQNSRERWASLERLTIAHARNVLIAGGVFAEADAATPDEAMQRGGFQRIYRRLVLRWLRRLTQEGMLRESDGRFYPVAPWDPVVLDPYWQDAEQWLAENPAMLAYFKRCGALLHDVVTGRLNALETLFPAGSFDLAEGLYEHAAEAKYSNAIVAAAAKAAVRGWGRKRNARILELGAGTGGTTTAVLPLLPAGQTEYWYTDVSELFLNRARQKFSAFGFVRYALFDLERGVAEQGFESRGFDVVLAANVVHATRNVNAALGRIRELLAPGGVALLLETTRHQSCFDMSIGLIEGWQHFEDDERSEHPLLDADAWRRVLRQNGFADALTLPSEGSPAAEIGQHVILARRDPEDRAASAAGERAERRELPPAHERLDAGDAMGAELGSLSRVERLQKVSEIVRITICRVFQLEMSANEVNERDRLSDLGMDSLIALELRGELGKALGLEGKISSTIAFDTGTVGELTRSIAGLLAHDIDEARQGGDNAETRAANTSSLTVELLQGLTDEKVEEMLKDRLSKR
jgi:3-oxoacyl-(acyl-carrier-protein) synthase/SAM-dependent methyltransferase/acyl carrier protein